MASRKIIFLIIIGIIVALLIFGIFLFSQSKEREQSESVSSISLWVVGGTTENYTTLLEGARKNIPELKNTLFDVRVFPNYEGYRDILLNTLSNGGGPDIFMIEAGADSILESKSIPIPEEFVDLRDFEKRFEDIFLSLLVSSGEGTSIRRSIKGSPLGYETLGIFYHKSLFSLFPKTWNELDILYREQTGEGQFFPINIGMGPSYTPGATDIIGLFLINNDITQTKDIMNGGGALSDYMRYGDTPIGGGERDSSGEIPTSTKLEGEREMLDKEGLTTADLFIRGRIGAMIGYPSTLREIEKASKRAEGSRLDDLILTERIPIRSLSEKRKNIARYSYLGLSANSKNPIASAKILGYLMSSPGLEKVREVFPYLISPDRTISTTQGTTSLSTLFSRTRLDSFIPSIGEELTIYSYGVKHEYEKIFREYIDRSGNIDMNSILSGLQKSIECKIESASGSVLNQKCIE